VTSICGCLIDKNHGGCGRGLSFIFSVEPEDILLMHARDAVTAKGIDSITNSMNQQLHYAEREQELIKKSPKHNGYFFLDDKHFVPPSKISSVDELLVRTSDADSGYNEVLIAGAGVSGKGSNPLPQAIFLEQSYLDMLTVTPYSDLQKQDAINLNILQNATLPIVTAKITYDPSLKYEGKLTKEKLKSFTTEFSRMVEEYNNLSLAKRRLTDGKMAHEKVDEQVSEKVCSIKRMLDLSLKVNMIDASEHHRVLELIDKHSMVKDIPINDVNNSAASKIQSSYRAYKAAKQETLDTRASEMQAEEEVVVGKDLSIVHHVDESGGGGGTAGGEKPESKETIMFGQEVARARDAAEIESRPDRSTATGAAAEPDKNPRSQLRKDSRND